MDGRDVGAEIQELLALLVKEEEEEGWEDVVTAAREERIAQSFHSVAFLYRAKVIDDIRSTTVRLTSR